MQAATSFFKGEKQDAELSPYIYESVLAEHYGWNLDAIRMMSTKDFDVHLRICLAKEVADKEFQALLAGAGVGDSKASKKFDKSKLNVPNKQEQQKVAGRETQVENIIKFDGKVKEVRIK